MIDLQELNKKIDELKMVKQEIINEECKFLSTEKYKIKLNNGETIIREKLLKNGTQKSAVVILAITLENEILLSVEPRVFTNETVLANLPAGYKEENETIYEAALRELKEETGYTTNDIELLNSYYQDQGISGALNYAFICRNCIKVSNQKLDESEYINIYKCDYEKINELIEMGYIKDANSILTILSAKERELRKNVRCKKRNK